MVNVAKASPADADWLLCHDKHVDERWVLRCIDLGEYRVARLEADILGFLRFSHFWGRIPYMEMVWIMPTHRRCGIGTALFHAWEAEMRLLGSALLMTSSEADEVEPQNWHRRNGFSDAGSIRFSSDFQTTPEVFLIKQIA